MWNFYYFLGIDQTRSETVGTNLADGEWHTVRVGVAPGRGRVCLSVDNDIECVRPRSGPSVLNTGDDSNNVRWALNYAFVWVNIYIPDLWLVSCQSKVLQLIWLIWLSNENHWMVKWNCLRFWMKVAVNHCCL